MQKYITKNDQSNISYHARPLSPSLSNKQHHKHNYNTPKLDLKKFNQYFQQRLQRKVAKNDFNFNKKNQKHSQLLQDQSYQYKNSFKNIANKQQKYKESRRQNAKQENNQWRKHQSIQKLSQKSQFKIQNRLKNENQNQSLHQLEQNYQQLQNKYKLLMSQFASQARRYDDDKQKLNYLIKNHQENQKIISKLRGQLKSMHQYKSTENLSISIQSNNKKQYKNQSSQAVIINNSSQKVLYSPEVNWNTQKNQIKAIPIPRNFKTSQSWTQKQDTINMSSQRPKTKQRYHSAQKILESTRKDLKTKKISNLSESKSQYKLKESNVRDSKKFKPTTELCIRLQNDSSKCTITQSTNLQKKVITSNIYSKYRFQPSVRLG